MIGEKYPIGTELRTLHGTIWIKTAIDEWVTRTVTGELDMWDSYTDSEVYGIASLPNIA